MEEDKNHLQKSEDFQNVEEDEQLLESKALSSKLELKHSRMMERLLNKYQKLQEKQNLQETSENFITKNYTFINSKFESMRRKKFEISQDTKDSNTREKVIINRRVLNDYIHVVNKRQDIVDSMGEQFWEMVEMYDGTLNYFNNYYGKNLEDQVEKLRQTIKPVHRFLLKTVDRNESRIKRRIEQFLSIRDSSDPKLLKELEERQNLKEIACQNQQIIKQRKESRRNQAKSQGHIDKLQKRQGYIMDEQPISSIRQNQQVMNQVQKYGSDSIKRQIFESDMKQMIETSQIKGKKSQIQKQFERMSSHSKIILGKDKIHPPDKLRSQTSHQQQQNTPYLQLNKEEEINERVNLNQQQQNAPFSYESLNPKQQKSCFRLDEDIETQSNIQPDSSIQSPMKVSALAIPVSGVIDQTVENTSSYLSPSRRYLSHIDQTEVMIPQKRVNNNENTQQNVRLESDCKYTKGLPQSKNSVSFEIPLSSKRLLVRTKSQHIEKNIIGIENTKYPIKNMVSYSFNNLSSSPTLQSLRINSLDSERILNIKPILHTHTRLQSFDHFLKNQTADTSEEINNQQNKSILINDHTPLSSQLKKQSTNTNSMKNTTSIRENISINGSQNVQLLGLPSASFTDRPSITSMTRLSNTIINLGNNQQIRLQKQVPFSCDSTRSGMKKDVYNLPDSSLASSVRPPISSLIEVQVPEILRIEEKKEPRQLFSEIDSQLSVKLIKQKSDWIGASRVQEMKSLSPSRDTCSIKSNNPLVRDHIYIESDMFKYKKINQYVISEYYQKKILNVHSDEIPLLSADEVNKIEQEKLAKVMSQPKYGATPNKDVYWNNLEEKKAEFMGLEKQPSLIIDPDEEINLEASIEKKYGSEINKRYKDIQKSCTEEMQSTKSVTQNLVEDLREFEQDHKKIKKNYNDHLKPKIYKSIYVEQALSQMKRQMNTKAGKPQRKARSQSPEKALQQSINQEKKKSFWGRTIRREIPLQSGEKKYSLINQRLQSPFEERQRQLKEQMKYLSSPNRSDKQQV